MRDPRHNMRTEKLLEDLAQVNPYNRLGENKHNAYYLYQMGFLASFLVTLMEEDSLVAARFRRLLELQRERKKNT